jgi:hypothetical protein
MYRDILRRNATVCDSLTMLVSRRKMLRLKDIFAFRRGFNT